MRNNKRNNDRNGRLARAARPIYGQCVNYERYSTSSGEMNRPKRHTNRHTCRQSGVAEVLMMQMTCLFQFPIEID